jgi:hypothetical protein
VTADFTPVDPDKIVGSGNPAPDMNNTSLELLAAGGTWNVLDEGFAGGADPTGSTDCAAAFNAALNAAPAGQTITVPPAYWTGGGWAQAVYKVNSPVVIPAYTGLVSLGFRAHGSAYDWSGVTMNGPIIKPSASFSGAGAIEMINNTANEKGGQVLRGINIDGTSAPGTTHGIYAQGNIFAPVIGDCMVYNMPGTGIYNLLGTGGGNGPDDWYVARCKISHCGVGINTTAPDSWWIDVESSECTGSNWQIAAGGNSRYIGCKGENSSGGYGFSVVVGNTGGQFFIGCDTQINYLSGWNITGPANAEGNGFVLLTGCTSTADAAVEGVVHAGLRVNNCAAAVLAPGFVSILTDGGAYPPYGATLTGSSNTLVLTGAYLQGNIAATHDDGSNTIPLVSQLPVPPNPAGTNYGPAGFGNNSSNATQTANLLVLYKITIRENNTLTGLVVENGGTAAGNILVGLYNAAGTAKLAASASTAQSGTFAAQAVPFAAAVNVTPGEYIAAVMFSSSSATASVQIFASPAATAAQGSFALPATVTPPASIHTASLPTAITY